jgi:hypothetical protein
MPRFIVKTEGSNKLDLRKTCEEFVKDVWVPTHLTPEQAAAFVLDCFKRTVQSELKLLEVE